MTPSQDVLYTEDSPDYFPVSTDFSAFGLEKTVVQGQTPGQAVQAVPIPVTPPVPSPSVGGETGVPLDLGWTEGMRPSRIGGKFTGEVLVVPGPQTNPVYESMGNFDQQTLNAYPAMEDIASSRKRSPLAEHIRDLFHGGNNG